MPAPSPADNAGWLNEISGQWIPATRFVVAQIMDELQVSKEARRAAKPATTIDVTDLLAYEQRSHAEFRVDVENRLQTLLGDRYAINVSPLYRRDRQLMLHVSLKGKESS